MKDTAMPRDWAKGPEGATPGSEPPSVLNYYLNLGTKEDVEKGAIVSSGLSVPALKLWVIVWMLIAIPSTLGTTSLFLTKRGTIETVNPKHLLCPSFQGLVLPSR